MDIVAVLCLQNRLLQTQMLKTPENGSLTRVMALIPPTAGRLSAEQKTSQYDCFSTTKKHIREGSSESFFYKVFQYLFISGMSVLLNYSAVKWCIGVLAHIPEVRGSKLSAALIHLLAKPRVINYPATSEI